MRVLIVGVEYDRDRLTRGPRCIKLSLVEGNFGRKREGGEQSQRDRKSCNDGFHTFSERVGTSR